MDRLKEKVLNADFKKLARIYIIVAVLLVIAGSAAAALSLQVQIKEAASLYRNHEITAEAQQQAQNSSLQVYEAHDFDWDHAEKYVTPIGTGAKAVLAADMFIGAVLAAAYWLLIALWLYKAASKAKMRGLLWLIAGLAGNLFAVIAFLVIREFIRIRCPQCRSWQHRHSYCANCGAELRASCPCCGSTVDITDIYCSSCGQKLLDDID